MDWLYFRFGQIGVYCFIWFAECSSKYIENKQSQTSVQFGWDDASCMKTLKSVAVNSNKAVSVNAVTFVLNSISIVCYYLLVYTTQVNSAFHAC